MILSIRQAGDPALHEVCQSVPLVDGGLPADIIAVAKAMVDTMHASHGIGLAANQVGFFVRVIVIANGGQPYVMINPEIVRADGEQLSNEGCLSVGRGIPRGVVRRAKRVVVKYVDVDSAERKAKLHGLWAACAQHEIDHLNGILYTDKVIKL